MDNDLHDLLHAQVKVEQCHEEEGKWQKIVNDLLNKMILKDKDAK